MRNQTLKTWSVFAAVALFWACNNAAVSASEPESELLISNHRIDITSFYHGTTIKAEGVIPAGCQATLVIMGEKKEHPLNRKGRVGPLWMNVGTATIKGAPETYYLLSSVDSLQKLAPVEMLKKYNIGYDAVRDGVTFEGAQSQTDELFREFIKLKEGSGLYKTSLNSIRLEPQGKDFTHFTTEIPIPAKIPPGEYGVHMYCFNGQEFSSNSSSEFSVVKVGLPQKVSALAFNHPAVYGLFSIVIAMAAGIFMGLVFGSKKEEPH
jgi:uncharacterized protein (TIGR02186 family)